MYITKQKKPLEVATCSVTYLEDTLTTGSSGGNEITAVQWIGGEAHGGRERCIELQAVFGGSENILCDTMLNTGL